MYRPTPSNFNLPAVVRPEVVGWKKLVLHYHYVYEYYLSSHKNYFLDKRPGRT